MIECRYAACHYAKGQTMLNVIMLNAKMLRVVMPKAKMLAP
jgi:hypothetical protein